MKGKIVILSAPSGTGKSTIIKHLTETRPDLRLKFSISATSRSPRKGEINGKDYYFLNKEEFLKKIKDQEFVEWEEVYSGTFYGTLESEIERISSSGDTVIMDVDVKGGINIKKKYGDQAIAIFVMPPTVEDLETRLRCRGTETEESLSQRLKKAEYEMSFSQCFDHTVINDNIDRTAEEIASFIQNK